MISRDKRPQSIVVKGGLLIESVLDNAREGVELSLFLLDSGVPISSGVLPFEAFDEIVDMVIHFGK